MLTEVLRLASKFYVRSETLFISLLFHDALLGKIKPIRKPKNSPYETVRRDF